MSHHFHPHARLAETLFDRLGPLGDDGSHDRAHILRVWRNARDIARAEAIDDTEILAAAVVLHDCVAVEKNAPERAMASRLSAARAKTILAELGWPGAKIDAASHAIEAHSFSANIPPRTAEARVLRDADRLDAIGAIGIARCFYVAGRMGSALYDPEDFDAASRDLDDSRFAVDHFPKKLFRLADDFLTGRARALAAERTATMRRFVDALRNETANAREER